MALTAKQGGSSGPRPVPPSGPALARCIQVVDLGTQHFAWQGQPKSAHKVLFIFELPKLLHVFSEEKGKQPFVVRNEFTVSISDKSNMRPFLEAWMNRGFKENELASGIDLKVYLGKTCMLGIKHKPDKKNPKIVYAEIGSIMGVTKEQRDACPPAMNDTIYFEIGADGILNGKVTPMNVIFDKLYPWTQKKIKESDEWKALGISDDNNTVVSETVEDDDWGSAPTGNDEPDF